MCYAFDQHIIVHIVGSISTINIIRPLIYDKIKTFMLFMAQVQSYTMRLLPVEITNHI